jgi:hypothetical protein
MAERASYSPAILRMRVNASSTWDGDLVGKHPIMVWRPSEWSGLPRTVRSVIGSSLAMAIVCLRDSDPFTTIYAGGWYTSDVQVLHPLPASASTLGLLHSSSKALSI